MPISQIEGLEDLLCTSFVSRSLWRVDEDCNARRGWFWWPAQLPRLAQEQELVLGPEFEQRFDELAKWLKEYEAWEKWFELWGNRVAHNFDDQPIWQRKMRPEPPVWLEAECQDDWVADGRLANACYISATGMSSLYSFSSAGVRRW